MDEKTARGKRDRRKELARQYRELHAAIGDGTPTEEQTAQLEAASREIGEIDGWFEREEQVDRDRQFEENPAARNNIHDITDRTGMSEDEATARTLSAKRGLEAFFRFGHAGLAQYREDDDLCNQAWSEDEQAYPNVRGTMATAMRGGSGTFPGAPQRAQSGSTDGTGGVLVPTLVAPELTRRMVAYGGMRRVSMVMPMATLSPFNWPTVDDTDEAGETLAENAAVTGGDIDDFGEQAFQFERHSSKEVRVPEELMYGTVQGFDLAGAILEMLAERLGRKQNAAFTNGPVAGKIKGVVPVLAADGSQHTDLIAGSAAGITASELKGVDFLTGLPFYIDDAYEENASLMLHRNMVQELLKLSDMEKRPYLQMDLATGRATGVSGLTFAKNFAMAREWAASANVMIVGDFSKGYGIFDFMPGIEIFRFGKDQYESARRAQTILWGTMWSAGNVIDKYAMMLLVVNAA